ncbi:hypothetical protein HDZ31DRAFT_14612, partial [Schizophyllum fasciatum]
MARGQKGPNRAADTMDWSASVVTTLSSDTEPSVLVTFPHAKYIFNVSENTNRAFLQNASNWKKIQGMFFTQASVQRMSGASGLLMTFADATIQKLNIVGPPGTGHYLASARPYLYRNTMSVEVTDVAMDAPRETLPEPVLKDKDISIYGLPIVPDSAPSEPSRPSSPSPTLKRKRSASPEGPVKRKEAPSERLSPSLAPSDAPAAPADASSAPPAPPSDATLDSVMSRADFTPATLSGSLAADYIKGVHACMFSKQTQPAQGGGKKARKQQTQQVKGSGPSDTNAPGEPDVFRRGDLPPGFNSQLPPPVGVDPSASNTPPTLAYVVLGPRIRGKFDAAAATALGVPSGPLRGDLAKGISVIVQVQNEAGETLDRVVQPSEVMSESLPPSAVIILDVPSPAYIPSLINSFTNAPLYSRLRSRKAEDAKEYATRAIFHKLGQGVLDDARYVEFMNGFPEDTHHIVSSRDHCPDPVTMTSAAFGQLRLSQLDPDIFHVPKFSLDAKRPLKDIPNQPPSTHVMTTDTHVTIRPPSPPKLDPYAQDKF